MVAEHIPWKTIREEQLGVLGTGFRWLGFMKIAGGWLVKTEVWCQGRDVAVGLAFVPDPEHLNEPRAVE